MKFKKIEREFQLTDSTVNVYGFRLMTEGYQIEEFKKNPIGYMMHDRDRGVLLKWTDLRFEGDLVFGTPVINMSHPRAEQTVNEIENGFLNAASVGHIVALEYSDDPVLKLPGQTGPTVTKWFNRECSLVDIPGNYNAIALFDANENPLNLADFTKPKLPMKQFIITAAMLSAMNQTLGTNLSADTDDAKVSAAFNDLVARANKSDKLEKELNDLKASIDVEKAKLNKERVSNLIASGIDSKKITKELGDKLSVDYANNPEGLKNLIDAMPAYSPITSQLGSGNDKVSKLENLASKTWDEIYESGMAGELKAKNPDLYKQKFKEEFGTEPRM